MKTRSSRVAWLQCLLAPPLLTLLSAAPQLDFGSQRLEGGSEGQGTVASQDSGQGEVETDNKIFFGNNALNNVALGAAAGVGGLLVTQQIINNVNSDNSNNNNCNCGPSRRRRQINLGAGSSSQATQQQPRPSAEPDTDQKLFGLFGGGGGCNCDAPASVEFGADCKVRAKYFNPRRTPYHLLYLHCFVQGRPQGNHYYGCGCSGNPAGGLLTFGRRKRRQTSPDPASSPASEVEDTQNKFLNFRCIDAAITGKVNQDSVTGGSGTTGTQGSAVSFGKSNS